MVGIHLRHLTDIGAGSESFLTGTGHNQAAQILLFLQLLQLGMEFTQQVGIQCIQGLRPVQGQQGDFIFYFKIN